MKHRKQSKKLFYSEHTSTFKFTLGITLKTDTAFLSTNKINYHAVVSCEIK